MADVFPLFLLLMLPFQLILILLIVFLLKKNCRLFIWKNGRYVPRAPRFFPKGKPYVHPDHIPLGIPIPGPTVFLVPDSKLPILPTPSTDGKPTTETLWSYYSDDGGIIYYKDGRAIFYPPSDYSLLYPNMEIELPADFYISDPLYDSLFDPSSEETCILSKDELRLLSESWLQVRQYVEDNDPDYVPGSSSHDEELSESGNDSNTNSEELSE